jgi:NAD(P)-dependent dehydrogenase (short-subunit alcohol dehydrogenase family)
VTNAQTAAGGALAGLVNCAATFHHDLIDTLDPAAFEAQMRVNALAPSLLARALKETIQGRGAIVNFLDFKLASPYPDHYSYTLSKYALAGATEMLARALAPAIRVNAVAPGYVLAAPGQSDEDYRRKHADTPLDRGTTPDDIARAVRFLMEADAVTGQTIFVDSGLRFRSFDRDIGFE